ncbi:MAG: glycosyltransferase [Erysipelotrichaceae bacterium]|nr:glycosyltransferase [Erysipelotrichaceae bacterium]
MDKKITVVVPCYNAANTVAKTLDSLINQTSDEVGILAINDGSRDETGSILDSYKEKYPDRVAVVHKENEGIAMTRNRALDLIDTPYFGFLDSDDTCEPTMFEKMLKKMEEDEADVVVSNFTWVTSKGNRVEKEGPYKQGKEMLIGLFAVLWNKLYRTEFVRNSGVRFPDGNRYEDACFLYCLTPHIRKISFIDEAFVNYVQLSTSITHTNNHEVKNMINVFRIIVDYYKKQGWYDEYRDELEYLHIKFFLGNSFLRSCMIDDREDRNNTIRMGWELLNTAFPKWMKNPYLKSLGGMKNLYFSMVREWNIPILVFLFRRFKRIEA